MNYLLFSQTKLGSMPTVYARESGVKTTPLQKVYFALQNIPSKPAEKNGEAKEEKMEATKN